MLKKKERHEEFSHRNETTGGDIKSSKTDDGKLPNNPYGIKDVKKWHKEAENAPPAGVDLSQPSGDRD